MSCIKEVQYFLAMLQNGDNGQLLDKNIIPSIDKAEYDLLRSSREKYLNQIQTISSKTIVVKFCTKFVMIYFIEGSICCPSFSPIKKSFVVNNNWLSQDRLFLKPCLYIRQNVISLQMVHSVAVDYVLHDFAAYQS